MNPEVIAMLKALRQGGASPPSAFGPVPNMGNPVRPNPFSPDYNLNFSPQLPTGPVGGAMPQLEKRYQRGPADPLNEWEALTAPNNDYLNQLR